MQLFTKEQEASLLANGRKNGEHIARDGNTEDFEPVVKLFCPWGAATWLISEIDPEESDRAFGLCDLGMGLPEIGSVSLEELRQLRGPMGLRIERDLHFRADKTLQAYADEARLAGRIVA
jgi:hypothetical protein